MKKQLFLSIILLGLILGLFQSCSLTDNFAETPMYLEITNVTIDTGDPKVANSHRIQDVWVYVDGRSIGVYELPTSRDLNNVIPILSEDSEVKIEIFAGIRNNGLTFSPFQYPFFERKTYEMTYEPGKIIPLDIEFNYKEETIFSVNENFEEELYFIEDLDGNLDSEIVPSSTDVRYGNKCGRIELTAQNIDASSEDPLFEQATFEVYDAEIFGASEVFLEVDFKSDIPFLVGFVAYNGVNAAALYPIVLNATDEWTKIYIDMSRNLNGGDVDFFQLLIGGAPDQPAGTILVDNIRLLHLDN